MGHNTTDNKCVIFKFVNRKHLKLMLHFKKSISSKSEVYINHLLCPYYRYIWGKWKDRQRKSKVKTKKNNNFIAPFYGWGSTASRLDPL